MMNLRIDKSHFARTSDLTFISARERLGKISSSNLIVECGEFGCLAPSFVVGVEFVGVVTRHRKLQFKYALFERKSGTFRFAGHSFVDTFSGQKMETIWDAARSYIESLPEYGTNTECRIQVYEV